MELPLGEDYTVTADCAKALIASMKPRIAKMVSNYKQSGNGDGMHGDHWWKPDGTAQEEKHPHPNE
jgi:hypothetical protein